MVRPSEMAYKELAAAEQAAGKSTQTLDRDGIPLDAKPRQGIHLLRWLATLAVLAVLVLVIQLFAASSIKWAAIPHYLVSEGLLNGLAGTVKLTVAVMLVGIVLGILIAVAQQSKNPLLRSIAVGYIWFFRGVPALVQLLLWFNLAIVLPRIEIPLLGSASTNDLITPFMAALLGLGLCEAAYMAEIIRSGILAVPKGQIEAAKTIGMNSALTMRRIVLPQAIRVAVPPTGNQFIGMLKYTSLAYAVSYTDLLSEASKIYTSNFLVVEVLLSATIWYLILCSISSVFQSLIERRLGQRSEAVVKPAPPTI